MKALRYTFKILSFLSIYIAPVLMFGTVTPFLHGDIDAGLTTAGVVCIVIIAIVCLFKARAYVKKQRESVFRSLFLSIFPIGAWAAVAFGIKEINTAFLSIMAYWNKVIIFIAIGCLLDTISNVFKETEDE